MLNYEIRVFPSKAADGSVYWTARFPAIEGCVGGGDTVEEAIAEAQDNLEIYLEFLKEENKRIPAEYNPPEYNGRIALRIQKSTHKKVAEAAEREGVSINTFLSNAIECYIGMKKYDFDLEEKVREIQALLGTSTTEYAKSTDTILRLWTGVTNPYKVCSGMN